MRNSIYVIQRYLADIKQNEYSFFRQCSTLKSKDFKYHINNIIDFCNITQMKANNPLDEYNCFSSNDSNTKHTLYFDKNIHRPATLLQNSVFELKNIDGFGDCGVLAILCSILSGAPGKKSIILYATLIKISN